MSRILKRPMFRKGGTPNQGIMTGLVDRKGYANGTYKEKALEALIRALDDCNDKMLPEDIQTQIYKVGKENGYKDNLREWFKLIYEVVFGDNNGPRMGFFISFFGVQQTKDLIRDKIS